MAQALTTAAAAARSFAGRDDVRSRAEAWGLPVSDFAAALERSADTRFRGTHPAAADVDAYLSSLHLEDLALACACARG